MSPKRIMSVFQTFWGPLLPWIIPNGRMDSFVYNRMTGYTFDNGSPATITCHYFRSALGT